MIDFLSAHTTSLGLGISMVVNIVLGFTQIRSGSYDMQKKIGADYKERSEQLELRLKEMNETVHQTQNQIAELRGILTGKDKHIESLTRILQDRNPETIDLLKEIKNLNSQLITFMTAANLKTTNELGYQTRILEKREKRENERGKIV